MSRYLSRRKVVLLAVLQIAATGQELGPTLSGFVHSPDRTLRPILGVPGSAWLGAPVAELPGHVWVAPSGRWAIVTTEGVVSVLRDPGRPQARTETDERLLTDIDRVVWSPDGTMACLFSAAASRIQRIRISSDSLSVEPPVELIAAGSELTALAIAADGRISVAIAGQGIYVSRTDAALELIADAKQVPALAFAPEGRTLLAADKGSGSILSIDLSASPAVVRSFAADCHSVIALTASARQVHAVLMNPASVRSYDSEGRLQSELALERPPGTVQALRGNTLFLLNVPEGRIPATVLDLQLTPAVYFVPAPDVSPL